jgi:hypothetical protein
MRADEKFSRRFTKEIEHLSAHVYGDWANPSPEWMGINLHENPLGRQLCIQMTTEEALFLSRSLLSMVELNCTKRVERLSSRKDPLK